MPSACDCRRDRAIPPCRPVIPRRPDRAVWFTRMNARPIWRPAALALALAALCWALIALSAWGLA